MSRYGKEILIGAMPVLLVFLIYLQINVLPFLLVGSFLFFAFYLAKVRGGGISVLTERKNKGKSITSLTFDDIGGQERAKKELMEALDFLVHFERIRQMGIRPLKGILLTGPPGTGKTLMAKAAASYTDSVFISASGSEFVEMYVGVGASRVRDLFKEARQRAQKENKESAILFIDEIEVIGAKRDGGQHKEYDQTLNQLLTEMDGIHSSTHPRILMIAATNRKEMLDSALLRPGRFDRHIEVDLPDRKGRLQILNLHAGNKALAGDVQLEKVADESFGFSGAQLESVMNEAAIYAMRDNLEQIEQRHLSLAIDKVMMGEKTDREATEEEKRRVALHELGHAIVAEHVRPGAVSQVSMSPRGQALGYVRHNPEKDQYLYTKPFLEQQIMIALGGAAAEEIFYGNRSTGSRNDFEQALRLVRTMIDSGLTGLGIVQSEIVKKEDLMKENKKILDELMSNTRQLLEQNRKVFEQALDILLKEETLSGEAFRRLLESIQERSTA